MRVHEFIPESVSTTSGAVASVAMPLGAVQRRNRQPYTVEKRTQEFKNKYTKQVNNVSR